MKSTRFFALFSLIFYFSVVEPSTTPIPIDEEDILQSDNLIDNAGEENDKKISFVWDYYKKEDDGYVCKYRDACKHQKPFKVKSKTPNQKTHYANF